jgi:hypothetical protein
MPGAVEKHPMPGGSDAGAVDGGQSGKGKAGTPALRAAGVRSAQRMAAERSMTKASDAHGAVWSTAAATARKQIGKRTS